MTATPAVRQLLGSKTADEALNLADQESIASNQATALTRKNLILTALAALAAPVPSAEASQPSTPRSPVPLLNQPAPAPELTLLSVTLVGTANHPAGVIARFAHYMRAADLPAGKSLVARTLSGVSLATQVDRAQNMALLAVAIPALAQGARLPLALVVVNEGSAPAPRPTTRRPVVRITPTTGQAWDWDVLATPAADARRTGPLVQETRHEVRVPAFACGTSSLRIVADVTATKDGGVVLDLSLRNDIVTEAGGTDAAYAVAVLVDGAEVASRTVARHPLGRWLPILVSRAPARPHVSPNLSYLSRAGIVPSFDSRVGFDATLRRGYETMRAAADWDRPFALRGIVPDMGRSGGRPDIGLVSDVSAIALMTDDPFWLDFAMGQSEALMGAPWHHWCEQCRAWVNQVDHPDVWLSTDSRATVPSKPPQLPTSQGWIAADRAHMPHHHLVPYLLTGRRACLDALVAQATWSIMFLAPGVGGREPASTRAATPEGRAARIQDARTTGNGVIAVRGQVRSQAWALWCMTYGAALATDGLPYPGYLAEAVDANLRWYRSREALWAEVQGEIHGLTLENAGTSVPCSYSPWQDDYLACALGMAARLGHADAFEHMRWKLNWTAGRFFHAADGFNPADGVNYNLTMGVAAPWDPAKPWPLPMPPPGHIAPRGVIPAGTLMPRHATRWRDITVTDVPGGGSYGPDWRSKSVGGDFGRWALAGLSIWDAPDLPWRETERTSLRRAWRYLNNTNPSAAFVDTARMRAAPRQNIVPLGATRAS
ncbi:hypothetical protein [Muricoccus radiodurans]|uniref:hypothetical protein n=1 Tax=Muricoccus radiodurans TaxID=2231721 RepID=UPI003CEDB987